jgi:hypothetical protein
MNAQQRAAMKLALAFLQQNQHYIADNERHAYVMLYNDFVNKLEDIISQDIISQDAQPKQDVPETNFGNMAEPKIGCVNHDCDKCKGDQRARQALDEANAYALELQARLAKYEGGATMMLNTAPQPVPVKTYHDGKPWPVQPKPWVGLTDEDKLHIEIMGGKSDVMLAEMVEAKLREKNGGAA